MAGRLDKVTDPEGEDFIAGQLRELAGKWIWLAKIGGKIRVEAQT